MSSSPPALPLPFKFRRKSSSASDAPSSPAQFWYRDSVSRSPMSSSPPASSSPPPISPYSNKSHHYAHIASSPQLPSDLNLRSSSDMIDDMSMVWGPDYRWNSSIKTRPTHCTLPSFRSSFPSDDDIPSTSDCDLAEFSDTNTRHQQFTRPRLTPTHEPVFYSDSEDEGGQVDGYEFQMVDVRSTYFNTSSERGRWKSDPMPYRWSRTSAPTEPTAKPVSSLDVVPKHTSEPPIDHNRQDEQTSTSDTDMDAEKNLCPESPSPADAASAMLKDTPSSSDSTSPSFLTALGAGIHSENVPCDAPSPLPPSSPPVSPSSIATSPPAPSPSSPSISIAHLQSPSPIRLSPACDANHDQTHTESGVMIDEPGKNESSDECSDLSISKKSQDDRPPDDRSSDPQSPLSMFEKAQSPTCNLPREDGHLDILQSTSSETPTPADTLLVKPDELPIEESSITPYATTTTSDLEDAISTISSLSPMSSRSSSPLTSLHPDDDRESSPVSGAEVCIALSKALEVVPREESSQPDIEMSDDSNPLKSCSSREPATSIAAEASSSSSSSGPLLSLDDNKENRRTNNEKKRSKLVKTDVPQNMEGVEERRNTSGSAKETVKKVKRKTKDSTSEEGPARKKAKLSTPPTADGARTTDAPSKDKPRKSMKDKPTHFNSKNKSKEADVDSKDTASSKPRKPKGTNAETDIKDASETQPVKRPKPRKISQSDSGPSTSTSKSPEPSEHPPRKSKSKSKAQPPELSSSSAPSTPSISPSIVKMPVDAQTAALDAEILGMIIECLALSRASSQAISTLFKSIMQTRPTLKAQRSEEEWMEVFHRVLSSGDEVHGGSGIFGKVESSGKDDADRPLEAKWFYVPEKDEDQERATLIRSMMPRPGKRSVTKQYKQYYYQPLAKISRWDPEDEI